jgi:hypothetical protein
MATKVKASAESAGPRAALDTFMEFMCPGLWAAIDEEIKSHLALAMTNDWADHDLEVLAQEVRPISMTLHRHGLEDRPVGPVRSSRPAWVVRAQLGRLLRHDPLRHNRVGAWAQMSIGAGPG